MGRELHIRKQVNKAREAYQIAFMPDISGLYGHAMRWGVDSEQYKDADAVYLTHVREFLRDLQIDMRSIIQRHYDYISANHGELRAQRLIDWLKPGGDIGEVTHARRLELTADRKRLDRDIRAYRQTLFDD